MSKFMCHLKTNLSKEVGRLHDWHGPMFAGRYHSIPLSDEPEVQVDRLEYILSQGANEGLVLSPLDWPGVHSAGALAEGKPLRGVWVDRTKLFAARQKRKKVREYDFAHEEELHLTTLPAWTALAEAAERTRERVREMIKRIEAQTLQMHQQQGTVPLGAEGVRGRHPHERPSRLAKRPMPRFHAATRAMRRMMLDAYQEFYAAFRLAAQRLADGDRKAEFPENCYPPGMPFIEPQQA